MNIKENIEISFRKIREDMDGLRSGAWNIYNEQSSLKKNVNDWIMFLVDENKQLRSRISRLETYVSQMQPVQEIRQQ